MSRNLWHGGRKEIQVATLFFFGLEGREWFKNIVSIAPAVFVFRVLCLPLCVSSETELTVVQPRTVAGARVALKPCNLEESKGLRTSNFRPCSFFLSLPPSACVRLQAVYREDKYW